MQHWVDNAVTVLSQIGQAIHQLNTQLNQITQMAADVQATVVGTQSQTSGVTTNVADVPRFASGGLNRGAGLRFLDPDEQVLTAEQTRAFTELVYGLGSDGMRNITDSVSRASLGSGIQGKKIVEANFNFNAGITQEALPEVKRIVGSAITELKREIPGIVATDTRDSLSRMGRR